MPIFNRFIQVGDKQIAIDNTHPVYQSNSAQFFTFEIGVLAPRMKEDECVDIIMNANGVITATLPDGSRHANGYTHPL